MGYKKWIFMNKLKKEIKIIIDFVVALFAGVVTLVCLITDLPLCIAHFSLCCFLMGWGCATKGEISPFLKMMFVTSFSILVCHFYFNMPSVWEIIF